MHKFLELKIDGGKIFANRDSGASVKSSLLTPKPNT